MADMAQVIEHAFGSNVTGRSCHLNSSVPFLNALSATWRNLDKNIQVASDDEIKSKVAQICGINEPHLNDEGLIVYTECQVAIKPEKWKSFIRHFVSSHMDVHYVMKSSDQTKLFPLLEALPYLEAHKHASSGRPAKEKRRNISYPAAVCRGCSHYMELAKVDTHGKVYSLFCLPATRGYIRDLIKFLSKNPRLRRKFLQFIKHKCESIVAGRNIPEGNRKELKKKVSQVKLLPQSKHFLEGNFCRKCNRMYRSQAERLHHVPCWVKFGKVNPNMRILEQYLSKQELDNNMIGFLSGNNQVSIVND